MGLRRSFYYLIVASNFLKASDQTGLYKAHSIPDISSYLRSQNMITASATSVSSTSPTRYGGTSPTATSPKRYGGGTSPRSTTSPRIYGSSTSSKVLGINSSPPAPEVSSIRKVLSGSGSAKPISNETTAARKIISGSPPLPNNGINAIMGAASFSNTISMDDTGDGHQGTNEQRRISRRYRAVRLPTSSVSVMPQNTDPHEGSSLQLQNSKKQKLLSASAAGDFSSLLDTVNSDLHCDLNVEDAQGRTPLILATQIGNLDCVRVLVEAGASLQTAKFDCSSELNAEQWAIMLGYEEIAIYLLKAKVERKIHETMDSSKKNNSLFMALKKGLPNVVEILANDTLLKRSVDLDGNSPLLVAIILHDTQSALHLIRAGSDVNFAGSDKLTPLHHAARRGNFEVVKELLDRNCSTEAEDVLSMRPLHYAALNGSSEMCNLLINGGADIRSIAQNGETVLHFAAQSGSEESIELCLDKGLALEDTDFKGYTAIHHAAKRKSPSQIRYLHLKKGMSIDLQTSEELLTPLMIAAQAGGISGVNYLVDRKANVHLCDAEGRTAIHYAATKEIFDVLVKSGLDKDAKDTQGLTALHNACSQNNCELVYSLARRGCDLHMQDSNGQTALHKAVQAGSLFLVEFLVKSGCRRQASDSFGQTPLFSLLSDQNAKLPLQAKVKILDILIDGIDAESVNINDHTGKNFLYYAFKQGEIGLAARVMVKYSVSLNVTTVIESDNQISLADLILQGAFDTISPNTFTDFFKDHNDKNVHSSLDLS